MNIILFFILIQFSWANVESEDLIQSEEEFYSGDSLSSEFFHQLEEDQTEEEFNHMYLNPEDTPMINEDQLQEDLSIYNGD